MKRIHTLLRVASFVLASQMAVAQEFSFATTFDVGTKNVVMGKNGNMYVATTFTGTVNLPVGVGTTSLTSAGGADVCVMKLDSVGKILWAKKWGGTGNDDARAISLDENGNIYTTGGFTYTVDFNPGAGVANKTTTGPLGFNDIYVSKLDSNGNFQWVIQMGGAQGDDIGTKLMCDQLGHVYVAGTFTGKVDFNPSSDTLFLNSPSSSFIVKYNNDGTLNWAHQIKAKITAIKQDKSHNILTSGDFQGDIDVDFGPNVHTLSSTWLSLFICKWDSTAKYIWAIQTTTSSSGSAFTNSMDLDSAGNIYTTGFISGSDVDFDPSSKTYTLIPTTDYQDAFVCKIDKNGAFGWARKFAGAKTYTRGESIAVDVDGSVYTIGQFSKTTDFDPASETTFNLTVGSGNNLYISKLNSLGDFVWALAFGASGTDYAYSAIVPSQGHLIVTGSVAGKTDLDPTTTGTFTPSTTGTNFLLKLKNKLIITHADSETLLPQNYISAFPNPTSGNLMLNFNSEFTPEKATVFNSMGQVVKELDMQGDVSNVEIDGPTGIYYIEIVTLQKKTAKVKVVKE